MPRLSSDEFGVVAHEYAHLFLHSKGLRMPLWLAEGVAEVFSTIRIGENGVAIGGDLPMRTQTLRKRPWIPLAQLLATTVDSPIRVNRDAADVFYAESWAFTQMLVFSSGYRDRFGLLWNVLQSGAGDLETIAHTYGKPLSAIGADLHDWVQQSKKELMLQEAPLSWEVADELRFTILKQQDPADRFLVATARVYDLTLVTADEHLMNVPGLNVLQNRC